MSVLRKIQVVAQRREAACSVTCDVVSTCCKETLWDGEVGNGTIDSTQVVWLQSGMYSAEDPHLLPQACSSFSHSNHKVLHEIRPL